jgi:DNA-binding MarR family transcriptional regulator
MNPTDCIFFQLAKANQSATRFWTRLVAAYNVTAAQAMVLTFLYDRDSVSSSELGKRVFLDSATLTGVIDRLEALEMLERRQNTEDRRAIAVSLTESGRDTAGGLRKIMEEANREFMKNFSRQEQAELRSFIERIRTLA